MSGEGNHNTQKVGFMNIINKITNYLNAGYPCLSIQTTEEARAVADIMTSAKASNKSVMTWSSADGLEVFNPDYSAFEDTDDLLYCLKSIKNSSFEDTVIILRDIHAWPFDRDPLIARLLRDVISEAPSKGSCIVLLTPSFKPYSSIEKMVTVIDYSLPDAKDLMEIAKAIAESAGKKIKISEDVIKACSGLSTTEAENALALSLIETSKFSADVIYREKVAAVKRSGLLEIVDPDPRGLEAIGGLENLKSWIVARKKAYSPQAEAYGLPSPKGVMLVGVPGNGKSLSAKAFGTALEIPTLKLDVGSLFNSLVGESEAKTRDALALAEAISPCVLWLDEVDKGLSGAQGSGANDSGVTRRVFGTLLSWMQDKKKPVFLVMTANQVDFLPPEFLRKGRFDELFSIDLPHQREREEIASVLLKKINRDPAKFNLADIAKAAEGYTGAEIEAVITEALFKAFEQDKEVDTKDIIACTSDVIPLSKTMPEKIEAIRKWGEGRARPASEKVTKEITTKPRRKL
jgi:ATP-dependent 26S proteasome regulatory subunit